MYSLQAFKNWVNEKQERRDCPKMSECLCAWEERIGIFEEVAKKLKKKENPVHPHSFLVKMWINEVDKQELLEKVKGKLKAWRELLSKIN